MKARYNVRYQMEWACQSHASEDAKTTLCGKQITRRWYVEHNAFDGKTTCAKCYRIEALKGGQP